MSKPPKDETREERIVYEIVVDAYDEHERAMGWFYYLDDKLEFPFKVRCIAKRAISPLSIGDEIDIIGMAPEDECLKEIFVMTQWKPHELAVPLSQLKFMRGSDQTKEAVDDWQYWTDHGYEF